MPVYLYSIVYVSHCLDLPYPVSRTTQFYFTEFPSPIIEGFWMLYLYQTIVYCNSGMWRSSSDLSYRMGSRGMEA
jgi:succinate dehydrogenase hydrophobic anchor subunit